MTRREASLWFGALVVLGWTATHPETLLLASAVVLAGSSVAAAWLTVWAMRLAVFAEGNGR